MGTAKLLQLIKPQRQLESIDVALIAKNTDQPRKTFDEESIEELAASIKEVGLIQPITVRKTGESEYELISGERRLRAVKKLGFSAIDAIVLSGIEDMESAAMALVENLQREDLNFFEEAECYLNMLKTYCMTQDELAKKIGKSQSAIANKLRLLKFSHDMRQAMLDSHLSERHARALLRLNSDSNCMAVIKKINEKSLSVKETERLVDKTLNTILGQNTGTGYKKTAFAHLYKDYRVFTGTVRSAVSLLRKSGMKVEVEQTENIHGVDILIKITR